MTPMNPSYKEREIAYQLSDSEAGAILVHRDLVSRLAHFATVAAEYGYWNATPEENAAVGIHFSLSSAAVSAETEGESHDRSRAL